MKIPLNELRFDFLSEGSDLYSFRSSDNDLNKFFREDALYYQQERLASTRLAYYQDTPVGYFTMVNDSIFADAITSGDGDERFEARRYPAIKIAKLATHDGYTGRGVGTNMVAKAISIVLKRSKYTGCRIITVDSKPGKESFYGQFGFKRAHAKAQDTTPMYFDYHKYLTGGRRPEQPISYPDERLNI